MYITYTLHERKYIETIKDLANVDMRLCRSLCFFLGTHIAKHTHKTHTPKTNYIQVHDTDDDDEDDEDDSGGDGDASLLFAVTKNE